MSSPRRVTLKNGETRWRGTVETGRDPVSGKRRQKVITARTLAEFREQAARASLRRTPSSAGRQTVRDYLLDEWLPWKASTGIKPASLHRYEQDIRTHLMPAFGTKRLTDLTRRDVERWVQRSREGAAPETVRGRLAVLSQAMRQAYHWEYIERNPCDGVKVGRPEQPRVVRPVWSVEQSQHFLRASCDDPDHVLWRIFLLGWLRMGEALALSWGAIDWDAGVINVTRTATKNRDGQWVLGTSAKTFTSARPVDMDAETMRRLWARHEQARSVLVFPGRDGGLWNPMTPAYRLERACGEYNVPRLTAHGLRHLGITLAINAGMSVAAVSKRAGHANSQVTLGVYTHALPASGRVVADALGGLLGEDPLDA